MLFFYLIIWLYKKRLKLCKEAVQTVGSIQDNTKFAGDLLKGMALSNFFILFTFGPTQNMIWLLGVVVIVLNPLLIFFIHKKTYIFQKYNVPM